MPDQVAKFRWDAKEDAGKLLGAGDDTITIEAAPSTQLIENILKRHKLADGPIHQELNGNVET